MRNMLILAQSLSILLLVTAGALCAEPSRVSDANLVSTVDARLAELWLKPDERRFDQIGWADNVRTARRLAAKHDRPLFLFTMDGRVNTGRC